MYWRIPLGIFFILSLSIPAQNTSQLNLRLEEIRQCSKRCSLFREIRILHSKRYKYSDVKKKEKPKSFRDKLCQGGYVTVFKGSIDNGCLVAVKILSSFKGNGEEFVDEIASTGRTSHVNIVSLVGFCSEGFKRALVYEIMPNGSVEKNTYSETPEA